MCTCTVTLENQQRLKNTNAKAKVLRKIKSQNILLFENKIELSCNYMYMKSSVKIYFLLILY